MDLMPLIQNGLLALLVPGLWYLKNYLSFSNEVVLGNTKPVSGEAFSYSDQLAQDMQSTLDNFTRPELFPGSKRGKQIDSAKVILNEVKKRKGQLPDLNIFKEEKRKKEHPSIGILFSNGVGARDYESGFPLEATVQSLFTAADSSPRINAGVWAYDRDLQVIKTFDDSYNTTSNGLMPKKKGYYAHLDFALGAIEEMYEEAGKRKVLYVITRPIYNTKRQELVKEKLADLKNKHIKTAFVYLTDKQVEEPLVKVYGMISRETIETLPNLIKKMNQKL